MKSAQTKSIESGSDPANPTDPAPSVGGLDVADPTTGGLSPLLRESVDMEGSLISWARASLPAEMVPDTYLLVKELPTLPSGKLDRIAVQVWGVGMEGGCGG